MLLILEYSRRTPDRDSARPLHILIGLTRTTSAHPAGAREQRPETGKGLHQRFSETPGKSSFDSLSRKRRLSDRWRACPLLEARPHGACGVGVELPSEMLQLSLGIEP